MDFKEGMEYPIISGILVFFITAPILGCHTPVGCFTQFCGPLDLPKLLTESPCVMTTEVLDIRQLVQSPDKVGYDIGNQNQLSSRPGQSLKRVYC